MANGEEKEKDKGKDQDADNEKEKEKDVDKEKDKVAEECPESPVSPSKLGRHRLTTMMSSWEEEKEERPDPVSDPPLLVHVVAHEVDESGAPGRVLGEAHLYREDTVLMLRKSLTQAAGVPYLGSLHKADGQMLAAHLSIKEAGLEPHSRVLTELPQEVVVASASSDNDVRLWEVQAGSCLDTMRVHEEPVLSCSFSPLGNLLATCSEDQTARVWSVGSRSSVAVLSGHEDWVNAVAFPRSDAERLLVTASMDCRSKVWDIEYESCVLTLDGRVNPLFSVDCSPDGNSVLVSGAPMAKDAQIFDVRCGEAVRTLEGSADGGHQDNVLCALFSPDGLTALTGGQDKVAKLWDIGSGKCTATLEGHSGAISAVAWAPDGRHACTASHDRSLKIWRVHGGLECRSTCHGHSGLISSTAFAPDGSCVASAGRDATLRLWDTSSGRPLKTFDGHTAKINALSFLPC